MAASLQAVTLLFTLADDLAQMKLQVNVDEADVGQVRERQQAQFTVSAYPSRRYPATITRVGFGSTTKDNVVTYVTELSASNADLSLRPATARRRRWPTRSASLGSNLLMIRPGQRLGPGRDAAGSPPFKEADAEAIRQQIGGVRAVEPSSNAGVTVVYGARNWSTVVTGTADDDFATNNWRFASGRDFTEAEQRAGAAVCVIGATVKRELFAAGDPVGERLRVRQVSCQVIGVLAAKGRSGMGGDQDDVVVLPLHTLQRRLTGNLNVGTLLVSMNEGTHAERLKTSLGQLLRERRKLSEHDDNNFNVLDTRQIAESARKRGCNVLRWIGHGDSRRTTGMT